MRAFLATCACFSSTILVVLVATWRRVGELADRFEDQPPGSCGCCDASSKAVP